MLVRGEDTVNGSQPVKLLLRVALSWHGHDDDACVPPLWRFALLIARLYLTVRPACSLHQPCTDR